MANGAVVLPEALGCNVEEAQRWCLYGNNAINPSLSSPVVTKPLSPWYPLIPYEYPERCVERSDYPTWEVHDLLYNHSSTQQSLSLALVNIMNGEKLSCSIALNESLTRADTHNPRWNNCIDTSQVGNETSSTQILYDHDYTLLGIKQTWKCHDNVASKDESYVFYFAAVQPSILRNLAQPQHRS